VTSETPVADQVETLLQHGDPRAAVKLLESLRREGFAGEDIVSLQDVLAGTRLVHAQSEQKQRNKAVQIANAAQQNIRFLGRKAALAAGEEWVDPFAPATVATAARSEPREPGRSVFADARHPRSLALVTVAWVATLPVALFVGLYLATSRHTDCVHAALRPGAGTHHYRVVLTVAAVVSAIILVGGTVAWVVTRRGHSGEERTSLFSREGAVPAVVILLACASWLVVLLVLWNTMPLRSDFTPYGPCPLLP
jgi:hypothetical protein